MGWSHIEQPVGVFPHIPQTQNTHKHTHTYTHGAQNVNKDTQTSRYTDRLFRVAQTPQARSDDPTPTALLHSAVGASVHGAEASGASTYL